MKNYNKLTLFYVDGSINDGQQVGDPVVPTPGPGPGPDPVEIRDMSVEEYLLAKHEKQLNFAKHKYINFEQWKEFQKAKKLLLKKHKIIKTSTNLRETSGLSYVPAGNRQNSVVVEFLNKWSDEQGNVTEYAPRITLNEDQSSTNIPPTMGMEDPITPIV